MIDLTFYRWSPMPRKVFPWRAYYRTSNALDPHERATRLTDDCVLNSTSDPNTMVHLITTRRYYEFRQISINDKYTTLEFRRPRLFSDDQDGFPWLDRDILRLFQGNFIHQSLRIDSIHRRSASTGRVVCIRP